MVGLIISTICTPADVLGDGAPVAQPRSKRREPGHRGHALLGAAVAAGRGGRCRSRTVSSPHTSLTTPQPVGHARSLIGGIGRNAPTANDAHTHRAVALGSGGRLNRRSPRHGGAQADTISRGRIATGGRAISFRMKGAAVAKHRGTPPRRPWSRQGPSSTAEPRASPLVRD